MGSLLGLEQEQNSSQGMAMPQGQPMGMQPQAQGERNFLAPLQGNTMGMAGLLLASGVPFDKALKQANEMTAQEQQGRGANQLQQQKFAAEQYKQQILQKAMTSADPVAAFDIASQSGLFSPHELISLRDVIASRPTNSASGTANPSTTLGMANAYEEGVDDGFRAPVKPLETATERNLRLKDENAYLKDLRDSTAGVRKARTAIDQIKKALPNFEPGIGAGFKKTIGNAALQLSGGMTDLGTNAADIEIVDSTLPTLLQPFYAGTKGAISDRENATFEKGVPGSTKTRKATENVIAAMEAGYDKTEQKNLAATSYRRKFGTLDGFEDKWISYLEDPANDVIKEDKDGNVYADRSRLEGWKPYVLGEKRKNEPSRQNMDSSNLQGAIINEPKSAPTMSRLEMLKAERARRG